MTRHPVASWQVPARDPELTSSRRLTSQTGTASSTVTSEAVGIVFMSLKRAR
jgi:hypothetical protein